MKNEYFQRSRYTEEELETFLNRAVEYLEKNPNTNRKKVCDYAGVGISVLERFEKAGKLTLPKPLSHKQRRTTTQWATTLGELSGGRS